ncbi:MAG: hypothetical protein VCC19_04540 [Myxococcota bacterium]
MERHPLIALANSRDVKQAKGFREAAAALTGESLDKLYKEEVANAPRRKEAGKKYFGSHPKAPTGRRNGKDPEHLAMALLGASKATEAAEEGEAGLELSDGGRLLLLDYQLPVATAAVDKGLGDADPNKGIGKLDLLGLLPDGRLAVVVVKFVPPSATRGGTGDTPLRALLDGLALAAIVDSNRAAIAEEVTEATGREVSEEAPVLILLGGSRYWEICRKREAQKGAGWIRELERIGREVSEVTGVEIRYLGIQVEEDPGWEYGDTGPVITGSPSIGPAWEARAGKLKPKPKRRPKASDENAIVEADLSRPLRDYGIRESYTPGDRISHPTLGMGVVQAIAGVGKITVLFDETKSLLVHERP